MEAGLALQNKQNAAYTPHTADMNEDERNGLNRMLEFVPRAVHPPRVLGTLAQNQRWAMTKDYDEQGDEDADLARLAIKRAGAENKLCEVIVELCVADVEGPSIAAGWAVLSKVAARELDFDARLTPSDTLKKAQELLWKSHGTRLSDEEHSNVSAPGPLGGCSLLAPSNIIADAEFLSSWLCTRKAVRELAEATGRPLRHEPHSEEAQKARANLQHAGVKIDDDGKIELTDDARHKLGTAQWILRDDEGSTLTS